MNQIQRRIADELIKRGNTLLAEPRMDIEFSGVDEADKYLNDIENYPHFYVLACLMDRQIKAKRAWLIPYKVSSYLSDYSFENHLSFSENDLKEIFDKEKLHRFNDKMATVYYKGIQLIHNRYRDNAQLIWNDRPRSATIIKRFLQFEGVGIKIASMAANILVRDFKVEIADKIFIDVSPDIHVKRVFKRLSFTLDEYNVDEAIFAAREHNPEYPGIFDFSCWEIGQEYCKPKAPRCKECYMRDLCPKIID